ncbi:hypothetical protein GCM10008915_36380 [Bifidobacterium pullorum subsp. gallinarum]
MLLSVSLFFENCEELVIAADDVAFLHMSDITESMTYNARPNPYHHANKNVGFLRLSVVDKPDYRRITAYNDIVYVDVNGVEYSVDWHEEDEYDNRYQSSELREDAGHISVVISKKEAE